MGEVYTGMRIPQGWGHWSSILEAADHNKGLRVLIFPEVLTISQNLFSLCKSYIVLSGNRESVDDSSGSFYPYECIKSIWCCKCYHFISIKEFQSFLLEKL